VLGRFDPIPSGLTDAGRLRWFTKASLAEALEEAGWRVVSIEPWAGVPAPDAGEFVARLSALPNVGRAWRLSLDRCGDPPAGRPGGVARSVETDPDHQVPDRPRSASPTCWSPGGVGWSEGGAPAGGGSRAAGTPRRRRLSGAQPGWFTVSRALQCSSFRESRSSRRRTSGSPRSGRPAGPGARRRAGPVSFVPGLRRRVQLLAHQRGSRAAAGAPTRRLTVSRRSLRSSRILVSVRPRTWGSASTDMSSSAPESRAASTERPRPSGRPLQRCEESDRSRAFGSGASAGVFRLRRVSTHPLSTDEKATALPDEYHHDLSPRRMPFAYRACDVYLGPNRPEEGFGLPVLEALACGLPCLLSDTPGHREIAGEAAWYFPDGDPEGLAAALTSVVTVEARARARVEGPRAASRFDSARVAANLESAFERALNLSGGPCGPPNPLAGGERGGPPVSPAA
jgi:hypothetical protein